MQALRLEEIDALWYTQVSTVNHSTVDPKMRSILNPVHLQMILQIPVLYLITHLQLLFAQMLNLVYLAHHELKLEGPVECQNQMYNLRWFIIEKKYRYVLYVCSEYNVWFDSWFKWCTLICCVTNMFLFDFKVFAEYSKTLSFAKKFISGTLINLRRGVVLLHCILLYSYITLLTLLLRM